MDGLVAAAIHDVKNSLGQLTVWLEQLRLSPQLQTNPPAALHQAELLSHRLNAQLVELLAFYRAGQGRLQGQIADHDLSDFLQDIAKEFVPEPRITFQAKLLDELTVWAFDAYLLRFAVLDALRNAQRHARTRVHFHIQRNAGTGICLMVLDDGPGFPASFLDTAASLEGLHATQMQASGSGLGLSFARLIANLHKTPDGRQGQLLLDNQGLPVARVANHAHEMNTANKLAESGQKVQQGGRWCLCLP